MKIIHILEDYSFTSGGIRTVVSRLNQKLSSLGFDSIIISASKEYDDKILLVEGENTPWRYSKDWNRMLNGIHNESAIDVIHIHGVWMYPQYVAAKFAYKQKIPFIITPHGMYEPWLWTKGSLKKKIYFNFLTKKHFAQAAKIHTITPQETASIKELFPNTKTFEIPNLIDDTYLDIHIPPYENDERYLLYLGRINPKKGIDILIKAFHQVVPQNVKLKIAGKINHYKRELDELINSLGIDKSRIEFLGMVTGTDKIELFSKAFVFVAPSHSEVVGMVNLEAAVLKTPVITTHQTGLSPEWNNQGGILINPDEKELVDALKIILKWTDTERIKKGEMLAQFVKKNYSWKYRLQDWKTLYMSCVNN